MVVRLLCTHARPLPLPNPSPPLRHFPALVVSVSWFSYIHYVVNKIYNTILVVEQNEQAYMFIHGHSLTHQHATVTVTRIIKNACYYQSHKGGRP